MKLSAQHDNTGLSGSIRSVQTGEIVHFQFPRGTQRIPVEVLLGDKRIEAYLRVERVEADAGDDLDVELVLRAPDLHASKDLDFVPRVHPPKAGGKIDQDGAAMEAASISDEVEIKEGPPVEKRETVLSPEEVDAYAITPTELALQQMSSDEAKEDGSLFSGEEQVGGAESKDQHPATQIPELPGVGGDRKKKGKGR